MDVLGTLQQGLIYSVLALGVFITFRVMNMPDLTVDGSLSAHFEHTVAVTDNGPVILTEP